MDRAATNLLSVLLRWRQCPDLEAWARLCRRYVGLEGSQVLLHKLLVLLAFIFLDQSVFLLIKGLQLGLLEGRNFLSLGEVYLHRFLQFLCILLLIEHSVLSR